MGRRWLFALALTGLAVAMLLLWPGESVLEIAAVPKGEVRFCARMRAGEEFVLSFVHSVNQRPVHETLRACGDHLVIVKSCFDAFGAGMPEATTAGGTFTVLAGGRLEWTVNRAVPEIIVRVGWVADHTLNIKGRLVRLAELAAPGTALAFQVRRTSLLEAMKGRCVR
jgi:hypothetical protein